MSVFAGNINPLTGAQVAGPMRPMPPRRRPVNWASIPKAIREHNAAIDARRPGFGIQPGGNLARLLTAPGMTRPLRRRILAAVQMSAEPQEQEEEAMTGEPKCRCWKPAEAQLDCPVHGRHADAMARAMGDMRAPEVLGAGDLDAHYASEQDLDIYRDLGGEA